MVADKSFFLANLYAFKFTSIVNKVVHTLAQKEYLGSIMSRDMVSP